MRLYNTLIGAKEEFVTLAPAEVKMYVCGPTTYNYIHLGNARPLVVFDTIRRYLEFKGYKVRYIQNFTDIDDKIINRAAEESVDPLSLSEKYIREYFIDADALGIKRAQVHPRVSEHIDEIIAAVAKLIECNSAYELEGNVYYRVKSFANYGFLSHRSLEDMLAGARVEVDERKEDPMDFALWKKTKPGELFWESPWGPGRPGWHIECSVMATNYLGNTIDIHGGGRDLIFPHHENEIAQAEALTGEKFVKYWLHNGFITVNDEKMSKSLGNFFILRDILKKYSPDVVRFYLINTHYRSPLDFDDGKLEEAKKSLQRIKTTCRLAEEFTENAGDLNLPVNSAHSLSERLVTWQELLLKDGRILEKLLPVPYLAGLTHLKQEFNLKEHEAFVKKIDDLQAKFIEAMDDDFNTAKAIGVLFEIIRELNV
ncbi:MAG: cysteine--tRNA ligase, partial [Syntrophomonadaceae bacterium]|nr:cysteine--tRNA ligase [Syntrophomonadaceae bacterium]